MKSLVKRLLRNFGINVSKAIVTPYEYLLEQPRYQEMIVDLNGKKFKIADSLSFYWSYREIFLKNIYKFDIFKECPVILDCGSNYGTSIVYFKALYPYAKIVAVEPDPNIYSLLEWNIKHRCYDNITLVNKAISEENKPVKFYHEGADSSRIHLLESAKDVCEVESISLDQLIGESVDFLKIDIEGAETKAICSSKKLDKVAQLFIEYHSFIDSKQTLGKILEKLSSVGFRYYIHTQFCSPHPLVEEKIHVGMDLQLNIFAKR